MLQLYKLQQFKHCFSGHVRYNVFKTDFLTDVLWVAWIGTQMLVRLTCGTINMTISLTQVFKLDHISSSPIQFYKELKSIEMPENFYLYMFVLKKKSVI